MNIVWQYLDKKVATINALKDYGSMQYIINNTDKDIATLHDRLESVRSSVSDGMPKLRNPKAGEDKVVACIDEIDVLKERYRQALEYMDWFQPAWDALTDEERLILQEFFLTDNTKTAVVLKLSEKLFIERSQVYYRKDKAVDRLALLLYGK
ncbi:hypothetical protein JCM15765_24260 [Paradesulfitobacterium aromaticivorans]